MTKTLELRTLRGNTIVRTFDLSRIYDAVGKTKTVWRFGRKFPFLRPERVEYTVSGIRTNTRRYAPPAIRNTAYSSR